MAENLHEKLQKYDERHPERVQERPWFAPRVDIYENDREVLVLADLPGVAKENLDINLDHDQLLIEGRVEEPMPGAVLDREYRYADFRRSFLVPQGIDGAKITADLKHGVLWLHLPKSEAVQPRRITVKSGG